VHLLLAQAAYLIHPWSFVRVDLRDDWYEVVEGVHDQFTNQDQHKARDHVFFGVPESRCDATGCTAQCGDDEVMLMAYCGATRNPAAFPTERSASCRLRNPANSPLIAACAKASIQ
jgi:hypothetical protein